jgi:integrase
VHDGSNPHELQLVGRATTDAVRQPSATPPGRSLKPDDARALLRSFEDAEEFWRAFFLYTSIRRGTLCGLRWAKIGPHREVAVRRSPAN